MKIGFEEGRLLVDVVGVGVWKLHEGRTVEGNVFDIKVAFPFESCCSIAPSGRYLNIRDKIATEVEDTCLEARDPITRVEAKLPAEQNNAPWLHKLAHSH